MRAIIGGALTTDARRITAVCTQLDADPQQRTVVARLHHLPFQRRVRDGTDSSQCPLDLVHLEVLALTGEQILEAPAPEATLGRLST